MADLLHTNLFSSFNFSRFSPLSLPRTLSPIPTFSIIRFSPLRRKLSHPSVLAKLSSDSSHFDIISKTENSDGSVVFKFGYASEVPQSDVEELESEDNNNTEAKNVVTDDESDVTKAENVVVINVKMKELVNELQSDAQVCEKFVEDKPNNCSISAVEAEISSDFDTEKHEDEIIDNDNVVGKCDSSVDAITDKADEMNDGGKVEDGANEASSNVEASDMAVVSLEDDIVEKVVDEDDEDGEDDETAELMALQLEAEPILDEETSVGLIDDGALSVSSLGSKQVADAVSPESDDVLCTSDIQEGTGPEASGNHLANIHLDSVNVDISSPSLSVSSAAASSTLSSEVTEAGHSSIARLDDDPHTHDISDAALSGIEAGITSTETNFDSVQISANANSMIPAAASLSDSSEVHDTTTLTIAKSDDDLGDILVAASPVTSGRASSETSLHSLNKVESSAPELFISSAVASLSQPLEALTGGKDAHFVSKNWFGVADGVGQWSLTGVDMGFYAHELMQNCENLLKSTSPVLTNVKDLLQRSAAMTQSTGSARVLIACVDNQVLHVANIGDSGFVVIRNGTVFKKSSPMVHEFNFPYAIGLGEDSVEDVEEYDIELEDGDVIVTATDGLFDNLYDQEIASIVSKGVGAGMYGQDLAELVAAKALEVGRSESARSPFADAAQAAGHPGYSGGKLDHVTVIVSLVQSR